MTRYEVIQCFANDSRTHRDHMVTFLVLTELWVEQGRPNSVELDLVGLLCVLDTKRSTLFRWLNQLESFRYIELRRAANQREKTTVRLTIAHAPNETARTEMGQHVPKWDSTAPNETAEPILPMPQMRQQNPKWDGTVPNEIAETAKTAQNRSFSAEATDLPHVRDHHNHLIKEFIINSKGGNQVVSDGKGVQGKKQNARSGALNQTKTAHRKRSSRPDDQKTFPFASSELAIPGRLKQELYNEFPTADFEHYHARLTNWKDRAGNVKQRADWLSTSRQFILNDIRDGKLVTITQVKPLNSHANRNRGNPLIEPQPDPDRRFGTW